jgi:tripartite-type tricarboxylate transporter receptor subunit TctC
MNASKLSAFIFSPVVRFLIFIGVYRRSSAVAVLAALACAAALQIAAAQPYPNRPIRLIVPYPPGSSTNDILGRALAARLTDALGQQVVVDNRSGASGNVGSEMVAKAEPDGYTLLIGVAGPLTVGPSVYAKLGYDPIKDLAPIARFATIPYVMVVNLSLPVNNIKELIALAKSRPGELNFASSGNGGSPHLCGELFKSMAGIDMVHVPYKGGALGVIDLLGGRVQMFCTGLTAMTSQIKAGKVRAIAMATLERSALMPELPTISEQALPGFDMNSWSGVMAPANTPQPIIRRLYDAIARVVNTDEMKNFMLAQGAEPALMDPVRFGAYIKAETAKWAKVVKAAHVKVD